MDICEKKHQIQDYLNDIYTEYNRMNESKIQSKCENDLIFIKNKLLSKKTLKIVLFHLVL